MDKSRAIKMKFLLNLFVFYFFLKSQENNTNITNNISKNMYKTTINLNNSSFIKNETKKNLIIVAMINYDWNKVKLFFNSFKSSGFTNCDFVVFFNNTNEYTIKMIKSLGIVTYSIQEKYNQTFNEIPLINYRWKIYYDYLNDNKEKYNLVLTADVRDSIFQLDVFQFYQKNESFLGIAIEDGNLSEITNRDWIINAFGERLHKSIEHERIVCIGTLWGTLDKFMEFSYILWDILGKKWALKHNVIEQAVVNYLIYHEKIFNDCLEKSYNENGRIMTLALTDRKNIFLDSQENILNGKKQIAALVHQYDRKQDIIDIMNKKYGSM